MSPSHALGLEAAVLLLVVASLAAVQARAVRGAQRQVIQDFCRRRRRPERYEEIVAASETIAFIAASIVVIAAVAATLLAFRGREDARTSLAIEVSAVAGWIALAWGLLVVLPMLLVKFAGPWIAKDRYIWCSSRMLHEVDSACLRPRIVSQLSASCVHGP
jgi:hypothetical protein